MNSFTYRDAKRIAADIDRQGYGTLLRYVSEKELQPLRSFAEAAARTSGGEYIRFTGFRHFPGTVLSDLAQSASFNQLCKWLYQIRTSRAAPDTDFYLVFRCLQGATGRRHSYRFHFDSHVVTALLPVVIPEENPRGDLLIIPNIRSIRRLYVSNVIDKLLVGNSLSQVILRVAARRRRLRIVPIRMQPGTIYLFWGYCSIHTNEPCDPDKLRATALLHYGDPHQYSSFQALIRHATNVHRPPD